MTVRIQAPDGTTVEFPDGTPDAVIESAMSEAYPAPNVGADVAKSAGVGLAKGVLSLPDLPHNVESLGRAGINWTASKFGKEGNAVSPQAAIPAVGLQQQIEGVTGPFYKPQTGYGKFAEKVGEFAPGALVPGGVGARLLNSVAPAVGDEIAERALKGSKYETAGRVAAALAAPWAARTTAKTLTLTPNPVRDAEHARHVANLDAAEVPLSAGARTGNRTIQFGESQARETPFAGEGGQRLKQNTDAGFTRALFHEIGMDVDRANAPNMHQAFQGLGAQFQTVPQRVPRIQPDAQLGQDLQTALTAYNDVVDVGSHFRAPVVDNVINELQAAAGAGGIDTARYQHLRNRLGDISRRNSGGRGDAQLGATVRDIRDALDDAFERTAIGQGMPEVAQEYAALRNQYRNLLAMEGAAAKSKDGFISPALMRAELAKQDKRGFVTGQGDYSDLVKGGLAVLDPIPNSGTPGRMAWTQGMAALGDAGVSAVTGSPFQAAGQLAAGVAPSATMRGITSPAGQWILGNQAGAPILNAMDPANPTTAAIVRAMLGADAAGEDAFINKDGIPEINIKRK